MSIKVRATTRGYYGGVVREAGDVFEVEAKQDIGSWMDPQVEELKAPKAEGKPGKGGKKTDPTKGNAEQNGDAQGDADLA